MLVMERRNQNEKVQMQKNESKKYWFDVIEKRKRDRLKVQKFRLILVTSSIALIIISVFTGKFEMFMNYLINLILSITK